MGKHREWDHARIKNFNELIRAWKNTALPRHTREHAFAQALHAFRSRIRYRANYVPYLTRGLISLEEAIRIAEFGFFEGCKNYDPDRLDTSIRYIDRAIWSALREEIRRALKDTLHNTVSLDEELPGEKRDRTLYDIVASNQENPEEALIRLRRESTVAALISQLSPREQDCVLYELRGPHRNLEEVGESHGITKQRAGQIRQEALGKIYKDLRRRRLQLTLT